MLDHPFTGDRAHCRYQTTPELICGYPRASHQVPVDEREKLITDAMRETGESREIVTDMLEAIECCASEGASEALAERRQAAREAFHDARSLAAMERVDYGLQDAIEAATRVQVTPEIIEAAILAVQHVPVLDRPQQAIIAAFRAAGFEVVE